MYIHICCLHDIWHFYVLFHTILNILNILNIKLQISDVPGLPAETLEEGGEDGSHPTGSGATGSQYYEQDEPVVPMGLPVVNAGIYGQDGQDDHDDDRDDMYEAALDLVDSQPDPKVTVGGDDDDYEYYYEDDNGNIISDNGQTAGLERIGTIDISVDANVTAVSKGMPPVYNNGDNDEDSDDEEDDEFDMNEMYKKSTSQQFTAKGKKSKQTNRVDSDISENMYGL